MKKNMFGTDYFDPSGLSMIWVAYLIGPHPIIEYLALSGRIKTLKGLRIFIGGFSLSRIL